MAMANVAVITPAHIMYHSDVSFYEKGAMDGRNNWLIANLIHGWVGAIFYNIALLTQILSIMDIAKDINLFVWTEGFWFNMFKLVVVDIFEYMAYAESKSIMNDTSRTAQEIADATEINEWIV